MSKLNSSNYKVFSKFLNDLAKKLTKYYYLKLNKPFKVSNKEKGKGYDPVTSADKSFEKFIRKEILKKFPKHQIKGEEFGRKKNKSDFTWVIDPIDGTRSFVIGNPTWSNLISLNYKGYPVLGLANFPILRKYYYNTSSKSALKLLNGLKINAENPLSAMLVKGTTSTVLLSSLSPTAMLQSNGIVISLPPMSSTIAGALKDSM